MRKQHFFDLLNFIVGYIWRSNYAFRPYWSENVFLTLVATTFLDWNSSKFDSSVRVAGIRGISIILKLCISFSLASIFSIVCSLYRTHFALWLCLPHGPFRHLHSFIHHSCLEYFTSIRILPHLPKFIPQMVDKPNINTAHKTMQSLSQQQKLTEIQCLSWQITIFHATYLPKITGITNRCETIDDYYLLSNVRSNAHFTKWNLKHNTNGCKVKIKIISQKLIWWFYSG